MLTGRLLYVFLFPDLNLAQEKIIIGQVKNLDNDVANVLVVNLNSNKSTITDSLGMFSIKAKLSDSIRFTAVQYLTREIVVTDAILMGNLLNVDLTEDVINLDEVIVGPYNLTGKMELDLKKLDVAPEITSSALGLPNADVEKMSQSERLLIEADRGKYFYFGGLGIAINTHKIMNRISGRTKSFEDMVTRDKNMAMEKQIIAKFPKRTISGHFNIPETNIDGFLTFCLSQKDFTELSSTWNTAEVWEYLKAKSIEFKKTDLIDE